MGAPKAVEVLKYIIEPELIVSSGADKKVRIYNLRIELCACINMLTGNKKGQWLLPFSWDKRRDKELSEVKSIYKELQRREDIIHQYYIKNSIMKGEASLKDLEDHINKQKIKKSIKEVVTIQEKDSNNDPDSQRNLPRNSETIKQIILEKPIMTVRKFRNFSEDGSQDQERNQSVDSDGIPNFIKDILSPQVNLINYRI